MNRYSALHEFENEFSRLSKKYRSLNDDLEKLKKIINEFPEGVGKNFAILHADLNLKIIKARMACRILRNRSFRVIYSFNKTKQEIVFIEIYFKGDKENEDKKRIDEYLRVKES